MENIELKAYAKINLGLEVLYKRTDGFHEINTVFTRINLFDSIKIEPASDLSVVCLPDLGIPGQENIVFKTASKLQKDFNKPSKNAKITINKNIPAGAGLGGGSSDAASALVGLNKFWKLNAPADYLFSAAAELGSDVPFFLHPGSASARGRGEILTEFDYTLPFWVVLVYPNINISTKWAYQALNRSSNPREPQDFASSIIRSKTHPEILKDYLINDFEAVVFQQYPAIASIKEKLYLSGAVFALMSGSGSSVYGLFDSQSAAIKAKDSFTGLASFFCEPFEYRNEIH